MDQKSDRRVVLELDDEMSRRLREAAERDGVTVGVMAARALKNGIAVTRINREGGQMTFHDAKGVRRRLVPA